jgi:putative addiction module killer protein
MFVSVMSTTIFTSSTLERSELWNTYGPGYRVYVKQQGEALIVLLAGGNKSSQKRDIERAKELVRGLSRGALL